MTFPSATSPVAEPIAPEVVDPALAADATQEVTTDANPAASSPVDPTDANEPVDLLSVVKSAIDKTAEPVASSPPEGDPVVAEVADPAVVAEPKAEDDADLPFHNHPRWKEVVSERNSLREERDTLRDPAERWGQIDNWRQEHNLSVEEVAEGYEIMALLKSGDHGKLSQAREWFADRLGALDETLGIVVPADLQDRIDSGLLDEAGAQEIARARAAVNLRATQDTARSEADEATRTEREAAAVTTAMVEAVNGWEARIKASDPDYSKKASQVQDRCLRIVQQTGVAPRTADEATALADRAHAEITAELKALLPKPRAIAPAPTGRSTNAAPAPTSLRDVVNAAVGR